MSFNNKFITFFLVVNLLVINFTSNANSQENFETWLASYKKYVLKKGISQSTIDTTFKNVKFLERVIKYDRKQPEFFEDTITYVNKRANITRVTNAKKLLKINKNLFIDAEKNWLDLVVHIRFTADAIFQFISSDCLASAWFGLG